MQEPALDAISKNARALLKQAVRLYRRREYAHSTHMAIIASEECSKLLLAFCRLHLPAQEFRRRYQHAHKHRVLNSPWYLMGRFSILYVFAVLKNKFPAQADATGFSFNTMYQLVSEVVMSHSPAEAAFAIMRSLQPHENEAIEKDIQSIVAEMERDRLRSVYVDISDDLVLVDGPSMITADKARHYIDGARVALAVASFVSSEGSMTIFDYAQRLPRRLRDESREEAQRLGMVISEQASKDESSVDISRIRPFKQRRSPTER